MLRLNGNPGFRSSLMNPPGAAKGFLERLPERGCEESANP